MGNNRLGIVLILVGMSFFSIQDVIIKLVILEASLLQILVFRALLGSIILLGFLYFTKREISFDNVKINDTPNIKVDEFINKYNLSKNKILNKITFKNFVNNLLGAYAS